MLDDLPLALGDDPEVLAERALAAMAALEFVFESLDGALPVPSAHVHALIALAGGAVRACPCAAQLPPAIEER